MKAQSAKILFSLLAAALLVSACGGTTSVGEADLSTQTGNPPEGDDRMDPQAQPSIYEQFHVTLGGLAKSICVKITDSCFPEYMSYSACERELGRRQDLVTALGYAEDEYSNFSEMIYAEESGNLVVATEPTSACIYGIIDLECDDPRIQAAFDPHHRKLADITALFGAHTADCAAINAQSSANVDPNLQ